MGNSRNSCWSMQTTKSTREIDSISQVRTVSGSHNFEVRNYALTKARGAGMSVISTTFFVGGYEWQIHFYPHGINKLSSEYISVSIGFKSKVGEPRTNYSLSLLDYSSGEAVYTKKGDLQIFKSSRDGGGFPFFLERKIFEASKCLRHDSLMIICDLTVIKEPVTCSNVPFPVPIPPSDIHERLSGLLFNKKGVDMTIEVGDMSFHAHKCVLAASSPVFEAQLFGQMKGPTNNKIKITDIEASVFDAMLYFIYKDTLPEIDKDADIAMTQHLLVAADKYLLNRLRLTCEQKLCNNIDTSSIGTTLALAEQHNLAHLKAECLRHLASPKALRSAMETDGFEHLLKSCPSVVKEIMTQMI